MCQNGIFEPGTSWLSGRLHITYTVRTKNVKISWKLNKIITCKKVQRVNGRIITQSLVSSLSIEVFYYLLFICHENDKNQLEPATQCDSRGLFNLVWICK